MGGDGYPFTRSGAGRLRSLRFSKPWKRFLPSGTMDGMSTDERRVPVGTMYVHLDQEKPWTEVFELVQEGGHFLLSDEVERGNPDVPLTETQRDAVVESAGWQRIGPWVIDGDDAEAPVQNTLC